MCLYARFSLHVNTRSKSSLKDKLLNLAKIQSVCAQISLCSGLLPPQEEICDVICFSFFLLLLSSAILKEISPAQKPPLTRYLISLLQRVFSLFSASQPCTQNFHSSHHSENSGFLFSPFLSDHSLVFVGFLFSLDFL